MRAGLWIVLLSVGCEGKGTSTIDGTINGEAVTALSAWWGGPFVVVTDQELDCLDMAWVNKYYDEDEPPITYNLTAVQFSYETEVVEGVYDVSGEAAVSARLLTMSDGIFDSAKARSGQLIIDEINSKEQVIGTYNLSFDAGDITGTLEVPWCTNVKG